MSERLDSSVFNFLRKSLAVIIIILLVYAVVALSYGLLYRFNKFSLAALSWQEKTLLLLAQPLSDVAGNGRVGSLSLFKSRTISQENSKYLVSVSWPTGSDLSGGGITPYTSQSISAVVAPVVRDTYWRIGYCESAVKEKPAQCSLAQVGTKSVQAIQNYNGNVRSVFGVNEKDELIDVQFEYFLSPKELGSIPLF